MTNATHSKPRLPPGPDGEIAIAVEGVSVEFVRRRTLLGKPVSRVLALRDVSFVARRAKTLGIVGESGSGKSTLARVLTGLIRAQTGTITRTADRRPGASGRPASPVQMVFQHPHDSLNPKKQVWSGLVEAKIVRGGAGKAALRQDAERIAEIVGLPAALLDSYPHQLSGGQCQRVAIGRALATDPDVLILDEPTSALDILIQAKILNLLLDLQRERGLTFIFISHDISVIRHMSDDVIVLFGGEILEQGPADAVLGNPANDYTRSLIDASPSLDGIPPGGL